MSDIVDMKALREGRQLIDARDKRRQGGNGKAAGKSLTAAVKAAEAARNDARVCEQNARRDAARAEFSVDLSRKLCRCAPWAAGTAWAAVLAGVVAAWLMRT